MTSLHLSLYVLSDQSELADNAGSVAPVTRLDIIEHMGLNRLLTNVGAFGKNQAGITPVVSPRPILRGFKLRDIIHGGPERAPLRSFNTDYYGRPLTWLYADEFQAIHLSDSPGESSVFRVRAALAYIAELPPDTPIILYWG